MKNFFGTSSQLSSPALPVVFSLYRLTHLLSLSDKSLSSIATLSNDITKPAYTVNSGTLSSKKEMLSLYFDFMLSAKSNASAPVNQSEFLVWSLNSINNELSLNSDTLKTKSGLFYLPYMSQSLLNRMGTNIVYSNSLVNSVNSQMAVIR